MEEWKAIRLGDIISIKSGFAYKGENIGKGDSYLLGMGCVSFKDVFLESGARRYGGEAPERYLAKPGDIVLATRQQSDNLPILGMPARIPDTYKGKHIIVGANLYRIENHSNISNDYLFWLLKSTAYISHIRSCQTGTTVRMITKANIEDFTFLCPPEEERQRITSILWNLEHKIELNNRINHNLEEQADDIVSSLLNVGTTVLRLSDICKYVSQRIDCQSLTLDNYISTENMVPSRGGVTKSSNVPTGTAVEYSSGDILVSNIRPYFQKIWKATYSGGCSNDVLCFRSSTNTPSFLYHLLRQNSFFDHVMAGAKGSKMPRGDKAQIMNWTFVLSEDWEAMESKLFIIDKKVALLRAQNLMLIELRDSVLPRLMSGELEINDLTC